MLTPIRTLTDNYIWLYRQKDLPALVVDIGDFSPLAEYLDKHPMPIEAVLLTHYHADHIAGVAAFHKIFPDVPIYGPAECGDVVTHMVTEGEIHTPHYTIKVLTTPGHTAQHVSYLVDKNLFCGDTLFSAGCGRVFTQNYQAMFDSLQKIKALPDDTQICAAHEYTLNNLQFAMAVANTTAQKETVSANMGIVKFLVAAGMPTLPTPLADEKRINPFLQAKDVTEFTQLRIKKDNF
ncbi:hydroxyacylglutathione hydrolase [Actinobacillus delphinicola]|uniref:Hydroxyacylglutathione hydrolase n=1 Tax=Actinobacillus delphinicola TaxID=51161 RepID=A0A448TVK0_9PAST|nr:hydroxyacylglutathione hydrolase [Actinobacillus delphinicola]VEJ09957.1 hydroxyacylglutathione hydrolase [Actinobacillus delphinicola]